MSLLRNGRTTLTLPYVETMNLIVSLQSLNALFLETMRFIVSTTLVALCLLQDFMLVPVKEMDVCHDFLALE